MRAAVLAGAIEIAAIWALVYGLATGGIVQPPAGLNAIFTTEPSAAPGPPPPQRHVSEADSGHAAPEARRDHAAPVLAAPNPLPSLPFPTAAIAGVGSAPRNGPGQQGSGSGAGGLGNGTGSGNGGFGEGDGGSDAELIGGRIDDRDYPDSARDARAQGTTEAEVFVDPRGKASGCRIARSSGNRLLDATTCRLALKRFRFRAARDAAGNAVAGSVIWVQKWEIGRIEDDPGA